MDEIENSEVFAAFAAEEVRKEAEIARKAEEILKAQAVEKKEVAPAKSIDMSPLLAEKLQTLAVQLDKEGLKTEATQINNLLKPQVNEADKK